MSPFATFVAARLASAADGGDVPAGGDADVAAVDLKADEIADVRGRMRGHGDVSPQ